MRKTLATTLSLLVLLPAASTTAQFFSKKKGNRKHQALVTYTDGKTAEGTLWLGVGEEIRFSTSSEDYTYGKIRRLKLHELKSFAWVARSDTLEQRWRWKEVVLPNGRKDKKQEFFGEPYPLRDLTFSYTAIDNQQHHGSLDTLVFYFRPDATPEKTEKHVIYRGKNRRDPGTSWEAFVQVQSIRLLDQQDKNLPPYKTLHFHNMQLTKDDAVTFMSYTHLNQRQAEWHEEKGAVAQGVGFAEKFLFLVLATVGENDLFPAPALFEGIAACNPGKGLEFMEFEAPNFSVGIVFR